jgi:hypothetical protein
MSACPKIESAWFIYDSTDLFGVISLYITAEVYFKYIVNYCEVNTKIWCPRMDNVIDENIFQLSS